MDIIIISIIISVISIGIVIVTTSLEFDSDGCSVMPDGSGLLSRLGEFTRRVSSSSSQMTCLRFGPKSLPDVLRGNRLRRVYTFAMVSCRSSDLLPDRD